jgi:glycosyltransferase involved in cell wall biosynthesis
MLRILTRVRICLVYDCLFPYSIGGVERWYRALAGELAARGCRVTYLTLRQWERDGAAEVPGVTVVEAGPRMRLYTRGGRRRILPALVFAAGVARHLARHGRDYDVVHTCSFPYFSVLVTAALRRRKGYGVVVDWFEVWSRDYWRKYLGRGLGRAGWLVQGWCMRVQQEPFCFSALTEGRLPMPATQIACGYELAKVRAAAIEPVVVFAGRHIPEKQVPLVVSAIAEARQAIPGLRGRILGDGPEHGSVRAAIRRQGLGGAVEAPGRVSSHDVQEAIRSALCVVSASTREGFGLLVLEASAAGTPSVLVAAPDNAAVELIEPGVNGYVVATATPAALADAIVAVYSAGRQLREATAEWYDRNELRFSPQTAVAEILDAYARAAATRS